MKKGLFLSIVALFMCLLMLISSAGITLNAHYCASSRDVTYSCYEQKASCPHCSSHHHELEMQAHYKNLFASQVHFEPKCCCTDLTREYRLAETVLPTDNQIINILSFVTWIDATETLACAELESSNYNSFLLNSTPPIFDGHERVLFFSQLKIDSAHFLLS